MGDKLITTFSQKYETAVKSKRGGETLGEIFDIKPQYIIHIHKNQSHPLNPMCLSPKKKNYWHTRMHLEVQVKVDVCVDKKLPPL